MASESTEDQPIMMTQVAMATGGEESTTVGADVTSLSNTPVPTTPKEEKEAESESRKLVAIPEAEEALEVGAEIGELCRPLPVR